MHEDAHLEAQYEDRYGGGTLHDDISGPFLQPYVPYEDEEHEELDDEELVYDVDDDDEEDE